MLVVCDGSQPRAGDQGNDRSLTPLSTGISAFGPLGVPRQPSELVGSMPALGVQKA